VFCFSFLSFSSFSKKAPRFVVVEIEDEGREWLKKHGRGGERIQAAVPGSSGRRNRERVALEKTVSDC